MNAHVQRRMLIALFIGTYATKVWTRQRLQLARLGMVLPAHASDAKGYEWQHNVIYQKHTYRLCTRAKERMNSYQSVCLGILRLCSSLKQDQSAIPDCKGSNWISTSKRGQIDDLPKPSAADPERAKQLRSNHRMRYQGSAKRRTQLYLHREPMQVKRVHESQLCRAAMKPRATPKRHEGMERERGKERMREISTYRDLGTQHRWPT
jgi:hypothetical protein